MAKEEKVLTQEQIERRVILKNRFFWILVAVDVALVIYLIIQIALLTK